MTKSRHDGDVAFIKALAEVLQDNDLTELEVMREYGDSDSLNVRVSRQMAMAPVQMTVPAPPAQPAPPRKARPIQTTRKSWPAPTTPCGACATTGILRACTTR